MKNFWTEDVYECMELMHKPKRSCVWEEKSMNGIYLFCCLCVHRYVCSTISIYEFGLGARMDIVVLHFFSLLFGGHKFIFIECAIYFSIGLNRVAYNDTYYKHISSRFRTVHVGNWWRTPIPFHLCMCLYFTPKRLTLRKPHRKNMIPHIHYTNTSNQQWKDQKWRFHECYVRFLSIQMSLLWVHVYITTNEWRIRIQHLQKWTK